MKVAVAALAVALMATLGVAAPAGAVVAKPASTGNWCC